MCAKVAKCIEKVMSVANSALLLLLETGLSANHGRLKYTGREQTNNECCGGISVQIDVFILVYLLLMCLPKPSRACQDMN